MRQGRERLVGLANTIRVLACESVFKRRLPGADAKCGDQGCLYVFWGVLLGDLRAGRPLLAYNLGNLWRRLALPKQIENWFQGA
jgi:hypothetical protein